MIELATQTALFAQTLQDLSSSDIGASLSHSLGTLAEVEARSEKLEAAQAASDASTLLAVAEEYVRLIGSVRVRLIAYLVEKAGEVLMIGVGVDGV